MKVYVIGFSHTTALSRAFEAAGDDSVTIINLRDRQRIKEISGRPRWRRPGETVSASLLAALDPDAAFVSMIGGNCHNMFGILERPTKFDFLTPARDRPSDDGERMLVPYNVIRAHFETELASTLAYIGAFAAHFRGRKMHINSPPPVASENIVQHPGVFKKQIHRGVAPAELRLKLFELHSDVFHDFATRLGMDYLLPPEDVADSDGIMKRDYWADDPTHGNAAYGELVRRQLKEWLA